MSLKRMLEQSEGRFQISIKICASHSPAVTLTMGAHEQRGTNSFHLVQTLFAADLV